MLDRFIVAFLPKRGNKQKNNCNELSYVTVALDRLFKRDFGFNLLRSDVYDSFVRLGYGQFFRNGIWNADAKKYLLSSKGTSIRLDNGYTGLDVAFIYIDIYSVLVRHLMTAKYAGFRNMNAERKSSIEAVKQQIRAFVTEEKAKIATKPYQKSNVQE